MSSEEWRRTMECKCMARKVTEKAKTYTVLNTETCDQYIKTPCKTVADGCLRRMRDKHGKNVIMRVSG